MIIYAPCEKTRNEETVKRLKMLSSSQCHLDPVRRIESASLAIAEAMTEIHGGEWRTVIDHQRRIVFVRTC